jgi:uncharacterized protein YkwD
VRTIVRVASTAVLATSLSQATLRQWMGSAGHRRNILDCTANLIGRDGVACQLGGRNSA